MRVLDIIPTAHLVVLWLCIILNLIVNINIGDYVFLKWHHSSASNFWRVGCGEYTSGKQKRLNPPRFQFMINFVYLHRYPDRNQLQAIYGAYLYPVLNKTLSSHPVWGSIRNIQTLAGTMVSVYEQVSRRNICTRENIFMSYETHYNLRQNRKSICSDTRQVHRGRLLALSVHPT